ncbi:hypothetical protein KSP39_PZI017463 [Platanthera zijinensis]|uniref:Uncharacterized protein n=1 Tax=Platanthera zijinensis TaxID=2320716 RepID=A0AAP0FZT3_9ASPA
MHLPKFYWGDAVLTAAYLINRLPSPVLGNQTPLTTLGVSPTSSLPPRIFGSTCFVHIPSPGQSKLDPRALKCVFIGYSPTQKGYKCYHPPTRRTLVSADVTFRDSTPYYAPSLQGESDVEVSSPTFSLPIPPVISSPPPTRPLQVYTRRRKGQNTTANPMLIDPMPPPSEDLSLHEGFVSSLASVSIPSTWQEALEHPDWKRAMVEEMTALEKNNTWDLTTLPHGKKTVGCKWVFAVKQNSKGIVERFKARLVARGYTQTLGIDYQETFAPVAKMNSIRVLLSCAACKGWDFIQLDVKNAFLHGNLEEEVYMSLPPGFISQGSDGKVCKLKKALYGLKQSPRAWFGRFHSAMVSLGYKQSHADHTLSKNGIHISQRKYILDLLEQTGLSGCRPADTPMEVNHNLGKNDGDLIEDVKGYQRLVGRLIYLSHTRPDIAYAVGVMSQYMHSPRARHLDAAHRILRYLKTSPGRGILFTSNSDLKIEIYTDADWAGSVEDRRSTSGYCSFIGGNLVTWRSKKQQVVSRSSAEAEFRAMAHGICEGLWLRSLMSDLGLSETAPIRLYCDNKAAISIANNPVQHDRTKNIEVDRHFIKEHIEKKIICIPFVPSEGQLADILTKSLGANLHYGLIDNVTLKHGRRNTTITRLDVYCFAIMLWELLHNKLPFQSMPNLQAAYAAFKIVRPSAENLPEDMAAILTLCWEVDPTARPNFNQIVPMLLHYLSTLFPLETIAPPPGPHGRPAWSPSRWPFTSLATSATFGLRRRLWASCPGRSNCLWEKGGTTVIFAKIVIRVIKTGRRHSPAQITPNAITDAPIQKTINRLPDLHFKSSNSRGNREISEVFQRDRGLRPILRSVIRSALLLVLRFLHGSSDVNRIRESAPI